MSKARITYRFDKHGNRDDETIIMAADAALAIGEAGRDKQEAGQRDGADKPLEGRHGVRPQADEPTLNRFTQDFGSWSSPYDAEVERLERIIRGEPSADLRAKQEESTGSLLFARGQDTAEAGSDRDQEDEGWVNGETGYLHVPPHRGPIVTDEAYWPTLRSRKGAPWVRLLASVAGAVATGVMLGLFVLTLFTNGGSEQMSTDAGQSQENREISSEASGNAEIASKNGDTGQYSEGVAVIPTAGLESHAVMVPESLYHMIQYGVFSTAGGAETAVRELSELGLAGVAGEQHGSWYVYTGVSGDKDDILGLAQQLKQRDFDVYVKQLTIPAMDRLPWNGEDARNVTAYFEQAHTLVSKVSALTLLHLLEAQPTKLETTSLESIADTHQQMMIMSSQIAGGFGGQVATSFQTMNNAMNTAIESMNAYDRNPSRSYLWQAQTAIMRFLLEHDQLARSNVEI